jgi:hypothetical protein
MMPRPFWLLPIAAVLLASPVLAAAALDGWGGYKFGMSPDAARTVPGQSFGPYSAKNIWNENKGSMGAKTQPVIDGVPYAFNLFFNDTSKLNGISLEHEKKSSLGDCGGGFLTLLAQQEKIYGTFNPVNPERKRDASQTPPTSLEWKNQGSSRYELATLTLADEYAYAWKARKGDGYHYVEVYATWASKPDDKAAPCVSGITFGIK